MFPHKSLVASATLVLLCNFAATNFVAAADAGASSAAACTTDGKARIRHGGPPGKSIMLPRRDLSKSSRCVAETRQSLVLASFLDAPGGQALVDGRIEKASRQIGDRVHSAREQTNLCVLRSLQHNWTDARSACDAAVDMAARNRSSVKLSDRSQVRQANEIAAAAYSNRAVMNWLAGDTGAAYADLANARVISPKATFVARNFEVAVTLPAQARLPLDPHSIG
jgi:hypothetical protein